MLQVNNYLYQDPNTEKKKKDMYEHKLPLKGTNLSTFQQSIETLARPSSMDSDSIKTLLLLHKSYLTGECCQNSRGHS